jgi:hypothetical protein
MDLDPRPTSPTAEWLHDWEPYVNMQVPTPMMTSLRPRSPDESKDFTSHKHHNLGDSKDPEHPHYQYGYCEVYWQYIVGSSKDRASLEALEDHMLHIPRNVPSEDTPLDDATREDTMREDAPLAISHDPSLSLPQSDLAMPGGFT